MTSEVMKEIVDRNPFRPFTIRLSNGAQYVFRTPRELGAAQDYRMLFHFPAPGGAIRIDSESIVEVIEN